jgi:OPT family oligopeptide transporter
MRAYEPVPRRWYATTLALSTSASVMLVVLTPSLQLPVWALLLAIFMGLLFIAPLGILRAVSDTGVGLNIISEFVIGYIMPGNPIGNILFKTMAYMSLNQALDLVNDLKLGHYIKIPPRHMFVAQLWGTMIGCVVNLIVVNVVLDPASGYRAFLDGTVEDPSGQWDGRKVHIFFSASVIWGLVGPAEFFSGAYRKLYLGFLIGAILPFIPYVLHKKYRYKWLPKVAWPIILHSAALPPAVPTNVIMTGFFFSWLSQKHLREKHPAWFEKFNYVLSAALDAGASVNALTIFLLTLTLLKYAPVPHWAANPLQDAEHCKPSP